VPGSGANKFTDIFVHPNPAKRLALVSSASQLWFLDTSTQKLIGAAMPFAVPIQSIAFHPDGAHFYALTSDKVFLIDIQRREIQKTIETVAGALFRSVATDSQGKHLFIIGNHEMDGGVGAILNRDGKEFLAIDLDTGKKAYQAFPPVQAVQFIVTP
jgi:hypothetical protein